MQSWGQTRASELIDEFESGERISPVVAEEARQRVRQGQERGALQLLLEEGTDRRTVECGT